MLAPTYGVILAAGYGTRMGSYTEQRPKALLPIAGKPLIEYIVRHLRSHGIVNIGINLHYHGKQIEDYLGSGENLGVKLHYVYEDEPSGTAGGVRCLGDFLEPAARFLVIYGDIISDLPFSELLAAQEAAASAAAICLHKRHGSNSYVFCDQDGWVTQFLERPGAEEVEKLLVSGQSHWVNSGIYCFDKGVLDLIPKEGFCDFPRDIFPGLIARRELLGLSLAGQRVAVDNEQKYKLAQDSFHRFSFQF